MTQEFSIRNAVPQDATAIYAMICELADFEKMRDAVESTEDDIRVALSGDAPRAEALIVEADNQCVAFALFFQNFSTFSGRSGLYLEDVFVRPSFRRRGIGKALLIQLAKLARDRQCGRFEWCVLDWNTHAISFYEELGAEILPDWRIVRLNGSGIAALADHR